MGQQTGTDPSGMLGSYTAPLPSIITKYMENLSKGGFLDAPGFNELFGSYKNVANQEADRQSAQITESLGSMGGGRYSSALLNKQGQLRKDTSNDLASKAAEYQLQLRQQQSGDILGTGALAFGSNEAGMTRLWADFLRKTSPPPLLDYLSSTSAGYGLPATVVA